MQQVIGPRKPLNGNVERLQGIIHCRKNASRLGVWNLHIENRLLALDFPNRLLDQRGLTDAATTRYFGKEPAFTLKHPFQIRKLLLSTVKFPFGHRIPLR